MVGCGLIGLRRAREAAAHQATACVGVVDVDRDLAAAAAKPYRARVFTDWRALITAQEIDIVCVATPNGFLAEIAIAALRAGKHVLLEKPMGRNIREARLIAAAAAVSAGRVKIGFNHRYHPAIARAHEELVNGTVGQLFNARVRYGHGGRPGYEREWRGNAELSGGGELTDQGIHVADLLHWFIGIPESVYAVTQTAVWPLGMLEDNAFALLRYRENVVASFHTSWTQWKNMFSLEVFGKSGSLTVDGLGGSYGEETLTIARRLASGGAPNLEQQVFSGPDQSWRDEWADFVTGIIDKRPFLGEAPDGIVAMETLAALYRSVDSGLPATYC